MPSRKVEAATAAAASPPKRPAQAHDDVLGAVKRRKCPGVRVVGRRIYDSEHGKTCHQCRQKTMDVVASCKASSRSRPCNLHYCSKCLSNRYGEIVIEVSKLPAWKCPKCRGECNCSVCLKKQGRLPTGILAHTAKSTGFTSVAELLKKCPDARMDSKEGIPSASFLEECQTDNTVDGAELPNLLQKPSNPKAKWKKLVVTADGHVEGPVADALYKTFCLNQKININTSASKTSPPIKKKKGAKVDSSVSVKRKRKSNSKGALEKFFVSTSPEPPNPREVSDLNLSKVDIDNSQLLPKKSKSKNIIKRKVTTVQTNKPLVGQNRKSIKNTLNEVVNGTEEDVNDASKLENDPLSSKEAKKKVTSNEKTRKPRLGNPKPRKAEPKEPKKGSATQKPKAAVNKEIILPQGGPLTMVAGIDFPAEAIGPAIQFIEFCMAFQSVLGLKKGDAEAMLKELTKGRLARKGSNSLLVQLHAKLLNIIENNSLGSNEVTHSSSGQRSWLMALRNHLSERSCMCKKLCGDDGTLGPMSFLQVSPMPSTVILEEDLRILRNAIEKGVESYENLGLYHKLQLLVILCDDSLETQSMREHMESMNRDYNEAQKGTRDEVLAARKEVRAAKQKIKDAEVAKLIAQGTINGPLTCEDQEALINKVKTETDRAVLAASLEKDAVSRMNKGRSDAVRTDAITWTPDHRVFYKLKGVEDAKCVAVQDCKAEQPGLDAWKVYSDTDEALLTKYLLQRAKLMRKKILAQAKQEFHATEDAEKENRTPNLIPNEEQCNVAREELCH